MSSTDRPRARWRPVLSWLVGFLTLYQGVVPLIVRPLFEADQRFAVALALPSPWWWLACVGIIVLGVGLLALLHRGEEPPPAAAQPEEPREETGTEGYDALSALVLLAGIYNGLAPFVSRLLFDGELFLAFTLRLPAPWWWIASLAVLVLTVVLLAAIDRAKERATGSR
ncbi:MULTISPECIES: hypothetical protein [unclassified Blastococcus]